MASAALASMFAAVGQELRRGKYPHKTTESGRVKQSKHIVLPLSDVLDAFVSSLGVLEKKALRR